MATEGNSDPPVLNLRTMEELCQPSLNRRGGPIAPIAIQATNFELENDMIQQDQNSCQFHGLPGDDANKNLDKFLHVIQSIKVNGVTNDALHLYLFPHSLTHHATAWFDRLPRNYINTFEHMAKMFLGKYFPPFMVTKLKNEITNFRQRPDESLFEAWECYNLSTDRCPNHNMLPVTQIDTFHNGLTLRHRDTINVAVGGTFMKRCPEECYDLIENMTAHQNDWDTSAQRSESSSSITSSDPKVATLKAEMAEINNNFMKVLQRTTGYDKIHKSDLWLLSIFDDRHQNGYVNVAWLIASLDTTILKELLDSEGRLIPKALEPGVLRVAIPRPSRASMQDLYERMGSIGIRQGAIERMSYR
nr:reverse transcriptase domain-containing protein [Tanacetum cinerariifolium]